MNRRLVNGIQLWQFDNLTKCEGISHFVTDRNSDGPEFTLSLSSLPDREQVKGHRRKLAGALGISADQLFLPSQIHGTTILNVGPATKKEELRDVDALITNHAGICVAVMSADCVPVIIYDQQTKAVAAVHSGWRGTVARILEKTLRRMKEDFGTEGKYVVAGIGPSVSQDSYEVGEEVVSEINKAFGFQNDLLIAQPLNKAKLDLWKANRLQLLDFGVPPGNIEISDLCTVKNNNHFFSARKGDSGRFAAGILRR